ncbi:Hsp70 family protein [Chitinimonas sp. BJB300]|uniref:Hsp70 family protein n=1 Tax=Chitinimonas sp. BJB300 TaxID=1559339 RepID=UPI000C111447|nr:Hsp70 family protein [Chitinimonas sp. BJB300]PHV12172.1 heat-shock protein [Chitinimonas sp. BJB300]TSJ91577.1 Hsp70 family protein [Chitinimonas sp. BJB300]
MPSPASSARACGIDFGTSNSTAGWLRPGQSALLALEDGKATLPSVVFFNAEEDRISYGRAGLNDYLEGYEGRLMRSLKSLLGSSLIDGQTEVMGRALPFRELLAHFIGELKCRAENNADRAFDTAVFGRPVHFVDDNETADQQAQRTLAETALAVGFKEVSFQFEPIAAAFHYEQDITREELVLIVDIGGGTSDFSLVRLSPQRARLTDRQDDLLANGGIHIGGTDFDKYLSLNAIMPLLGYKTRLQNNSEVPSSYYFNLATWHTINFNYTRKIWMELQEVYRDALEKEKLDRLLRLIEHREGHWLALQAEEAKIGLSSSPSMMLSLDRIHVGLCHEIQRSDFDTAVSHLVDGVARTVSQLLQDANLAADQIDTVFFTGGSSGVPLLRQRIAALLPAARAVEGDLFGSIGAGLAVEAQRRYGS